MHQQNYYSELMGAIDNGNIDEATTILENNPSILVGDETLIRYAASEDKVDIFALMLKYISNLTDALLGELLEEAALSEEGDKVVRHLLKMASIKVSRQSASIALISAVNVGNVDAVKSLCEIGNADPNFICESGMNSLDYAIMFGFDEIENVLRSVGGKETNKQD